MEVVQYDKENHQEHMQSLLNSRNMDKELIYDLPQIGFLIILPNGMPIAAGFLRECESRAAMLDSMITHADAEPLSRDYALDILVHKLIKAASIYNFKQIIAFTKDKNTLIRAYKHGFELLPHSVIALRLPGE